MPPDPTKTPGAWQQLIDSVAGGTPTKTPTPTATPKPRYSDLSETQLRQYVEAGLISRDELTALKGADKAAAIMAKALTTADKTAIANLKANPPASTAGQTVAPGKGTSPAGTTDWAAVERAYDTGSPEANYGSVPNAGTPSARNTSGGGSSVTAAPKPPVRNSAADLVNRGALAVGGRPVLEGQQYIKQNEVVQFGDGQWFVVDPQGIPVSGPFPNQTQASAANVYSEIGPAITSNKYANIGSMAQAGANRPRISAGSGQDAVTSIDQIIQSTYAKGRQPSDFVGAAQAAYGPVDIAYGKIPDYGGMRGVLDAAGDATGYTGRIGTPEGEIGIGTSAINQSGTQYGSQIQSVLAPYLSQSQINKIDPADYDQIALAINALREQNAIQQADTAATKQYQAANYKALTGQDPYELDILPETLAAGGQVVTGRERPGEIRRTVSVLPGEEPGSSRAWANLPPLAMGMRGGAGLIDKQAQGTPYDEGNARYTYYDTGDRMARLRALAMFPGDVEVVRRDPRAWESMKAAMSDNAGIPVATGQQTQPGNDIWRGLMADSPSWFTGPYPGKDRRRDHRQRHLPRIAAPGAKLRTSGLSALVNLQNGSVDAVLGARPEKVTVTPLDKGKVADAAQEEALAAAMLASPRPSRPPRLRYNTDPTRGMTSPALMNLFAGNKRGVKMAPMVA